ncbi:hypothetical protein [Enterococcus dispar]|uniref:hypothetical protein n=1 Tax=Enterococcus dispar TaxID=44009 RepID=UPI002491D6B0|nr:hypothetical protein [Enterococcus dispar]
MENIIEQVKDLTAAELDTLITELKKLAESKRLIGVAKKEFGCYNARRHSKPWIAKIVSWPAGKQPDLEFGAYYGNDEGGTAEIAAKEGDIIRWGRRDNRGNGTINSWGIFRNGEIVEITPADARELYHD